MKKPLYEINNFRVMPIVKIGISNTSGRPDGDFEYFDQPLAKGVAIEAKYNDEGNYVVIAFVAEHEDQYQYRSIGDRIERYCPTWEDTLDFRKCLEHAYDIIVNSQEHYMTMGD